MTASIAVGFTAVLFIGLESAAVVSDVAFLEFLAEWSGEEEEWLEQEMRESESADTAPRTVETPEQTDQQQLEHKQAEPTLKHGTNER